MAAQSMTQSVPKPRAVQPAASAAGEDPVSSARVGRLSLVGLGVGGLHRLTPEADDAPVGATETLHISSLQLTLESRYDTVISGWGYEVPTTVQIGSVDDFPETTDIHGTTTLITPPVEAGP